jgi:hypothetical protein
MITEDTLLAAGYRRYKDVFCNADWLYQKRILDVNVNTTYFVNLYYYKFENYVSWELDMSFERNDPLFDYVHVKTQVKKECNVEDVEAIAAKIFVSMDGVVDAD